MQWAIPKVQAFRNSAKRLICNESVGEILNRSAQRIWILIYKRL